MDHDTKVGGILFGAIALWLAVSGFQDMKAGLVKGRGRAIAAMGFEWFGDVGNVRRVDPDRTGSCADRR